MKNSKYIPLVIMIGAALSLVGYIAYQVMASNKAVKEAEAAAAAAAAAAESTGTEG